MTDYYVDPDDTGTDSGTQANPFRSLQQGLDSVSAGGDNVYCKHDVGSGETATAMIEIDTASGAANTGCINIIGCNSSWVEDGTRYKIDFGTTANYGLKQLKSYYTIRNLELVSSATTGSWNGYYCSSGSFTAVYLNNIYCHGWPQDGFNCYFNESHIFRCISKNNGRYGFLSGGNWIQCIGCYAEGNASFGFFCQYPGSFYGCIAVDNDGGGFDCWAMEAPLFHFIGHANTGHGIDADYAKSLILGCRLTNNTGRGINNANTDEIYEYPHLLYTYVGGNTTGQVNGPMNLLTLEGNDLNEVAGTDTESGYKDKDSPFDLNLDSNEATYYNTALEVKQI